MPRQRLLGDIRAAYTHQFYYQDTSMLLFGVDLSRPGQEKYEMICKRFQAKIDKTKTNIQLKLGTNDI